VNAEVGMMKSEFATRFIILHSSFKLQMIGAARFELTTSASQTKPCNSAYFYDFHSQKSQTDCPRFGKLCGVF
jgi:hypothetical protein